MRLKGILPQIISLEQTAFVHGRQITDNILVAHELFHSLSTRRHQSKTYMAVKTDISKAYDRVKWNFLETALIKLGFNDTWIG